MRSLTLIFLIAVLLIPFCNRNTVAQSNIEDEYQMKQYFMVFLKASSDHTQDSVTTAKLIEGHIKNIERLFNEKKLVLAGPFMDKGTYKGIFIFDVATTEEVIQHLDTDPAIKAGRFGYEIHPWYGPGSIMIEKKP
jgi:uncharacterized protein YciI